MGSWQETKKGLYRELKLRDFSAAFGFMARAVKLTEEYRRHTLGENQWIAVRIWLEAQESRG